MFFVATWITTSFKNHCWRSCRFVSLSVWRKLEGTTHRSPERRGWLSRWWYIIYMKYIVYSTWNWYSSSLIPSYLKMITEKYSSGPCGQKCVQRGVQSKGHREKQRCRDIPGKHDWRSGWVRHLLFFFFRVPHFVLHFISFFISNMIDGQDFWVDSPSFCIYSLLFVFWFVILVLI